MPASMMVVERVANPSASTGRGGERIRVGRVVDERQRRCTDDLAHALGEHRAALEHGIPGEGRADDAQQLCGDERVEYNGQPGRRRFHGPQKAGRSHGRVVGGLARIRARTDDGRSNSRILSGSRRRPGPAHKRPGSRPSHRSWTRSRWRSRPLTRRSSPHSRPTRCPRSDRRRREWPAPARSRDRPCRRGSSGPGPLGTGRDPRVSRRRARPGRRTRRGFRTGRCHARR